MSLINVAGPIGSEIYNFNVLYVSVESSPIHGLYQLVVAMDVDNEAVDGNLVRTNFSSLVDANAALATFVSNSATEGITLVYSQALRKYINPFKIVDITTGTTKELKGGRLTLGVDFLFKVRLVNGKEISSGLFDTYPAMQVFYDPFRSAVDAINLGTGGGSTLPANAAGVLTNDGLGTLTWQAAGGASVNVVATIAARDALVGPVAGDQAYVTDASADTTVNAGAALYVYSAGSWNKISEFEAFDLKQLTEAITNPIVTSDSANGFAIGYIWVNTATGTAYICTDDTAGAAIWKQINNLTGITNNFVAVVAPAVSNDNTETYAIGSFWFNTLTNRLYIAEDVTTGAAVWTEITGLKHNVAAVDPVVGNDGTQDYAIGSTWVNTISSSVFIALDVSTGAANWLKISRAKNNATTTDPVATNDSTEFYEIGSLWINTTFDRTFVCVDNTATAAIWNVIDSRIDSVADNTARDALTGLKKGDLVKVTTPQALYYWNGSVFILLVSEGRFNSASVTDTNLTPNLTDNIRFSVIATNASAVDLNVLTATGTTTAGQLVYVELYNTDTVDRDFVFAAGKYVRSSGSDVGTITIAAGESRAFQFQNSTDGAYVMRLMASDHEFEVVASDRLLETITQATHGFVVLDAVAHNGTTWVKAIADDNASDYHAQAIVTAVNSVNEFVITTHGVVTATAHGLTAGEFYWLDQTTAGAITSVQPVTGIAQSVLFVRDANTLFVDIEQPVEVTTASAGELQGERLAVTAPDVMDDLTFPANTGKIIKLTVNGFTVTSLDLPTPFTVAGSTVTWNATNAGYSLAVTDNVIAEYTSV